MRTLRTLSLLALLVAVLLTPIAARAADPRLTPQTSGVTAGESIRFSAEGFSPKERIVFWATAPNQAVLSGDYVTADRGGSARITLRVPADAIGGTWAITAYGTVSAAPAVAYFTVVGRPGQGDGLLAAVAPETGPPGTTFAFAATGFDERERASYWFTAPDGTVFATFNRKTKSNEHGRVDISWASPADAPRGTWMLTIQGITSHVARGIPFHIQ
jgi:hypothetical protein